MKWVADPRIWSALLTLTAIESRQHQSSAGVGVISVMVSGSKRAAFTTDHLSCGYHRQGYFVTKATEV